MTSKYPEAFVEQALVKVFSRGQRCVNAVAEDLNVNHHTLKYWMKNKSVTARDPQNRRLAFGGVAPITAEVVSPSQSVASQEAKGANMQSKLTDIGRGGVAKTTTIAGALSGVSSRAVGGLSIE